MGNQFCQLPFFYFEIAYVSIPFKESECYIVKAKYYRVLQRYCQYIHEQNVCECLLLLLIERETNSEVHLINL